MALSVSVVIPTLNGGKFFKECISALSSQDYRDGFELVIVDSGSSDGTRELAKQKADIFIEIKREEFNHGLTRNLAISRSSGELIGLLVQDAVPAKSWLSALVKDFEDPEVAGVYSKQVPREGCNPLLRIRLSRWSATGSEKTIKHLSGEDELKSLPLLKQVELLSFDNVASCIRRRVWEKIKFPPRRFGEDLCWAKEVLIQGYKLIYEPDSLVVHSHDKSLWYEFKRVYLDHQNWNYLIGLQLLPNLIELLKASWDGILEYFSLLKGENLGTLWLWLWRFYSVPYVLSQNLAQYLGGKSNHWSSNYAWFKYFDKILTKGV